MKTYLVGGAVRDENLGRVYHDLDYVVVGSSIEEMLNNGFRQVGSDFPVFLHPITGDEYALARKEIKMAPGYKGFKFEWKGVTLEEDLFRRDLTINAMAKDLESGEIIDPYGGLIDLKKKTLRHVSNHFAQDPLRILRIGRLLSQLEGFEVDETTIELCQSISHGGELLNLTGERVWKEFVKVLSSSNAVVFFEFLKSVGALNQFFPELEKLYGVRQESKYYPDVDVWVHTMLSLEKAASLSLDINIRFASLVHDLGKGITPKNALPAHIGHEVYGLSLVEKVCERFMVPRITKKMAMIVTKEHLKIHAAMDMEAMNIVELLRRIEAFRNNDFFEAVLTVCKSDITVKGNVTYPVEQFLKTIAKEVNSIDTSVLLKGVDQTLAKDIVYKEQIRVTQNIIKEFNR
jgi:tRNA nucleotidyltransferase (CCA-adding enzyme)